MLLLLLLPMAKSNIKILILIIDFLKQPSPIRYVKGDGDKEKNS